MSRFALFENKQPILALAPMAGVTDRAYRELVKAEGVDLLVSEMVSAKGILYDNQRTTDLLMFSEGERPLALQIFGSEPDTMAKAAQIVEKLNPDIIDINMGCPTPKIVKNGDGSALMRNLDLAEAVIRAVAEAVDVPVSVKTRLGWDIEHINVVELAERAQSAGAAFIAVHGRTRQQFYSGKANYDPIAAVKAAIDIPVIGNGDVQEPEDVTRLVAQTNCDGVMVGRGAMGNPWFFRRAKEYLRTGTLLPEPSVFDKVSIIRRHAMLAVEYKGEITAMKEMRKHIGWYLKGEPNVSRLKQRLHHLSSLQELDQLLDVFLS